MPSDYNAYLAHKALKSFAPDASLAETISAFVFKSGFSGGSLATSFNMLELPKEKLQVSQADWALSPGTYPNRPYPYSNHPHPTFRSPSRHTRLYHTNESQSKAPPHPTSSSPTASPTSRPPSTAASS